MEVELRRLTWLQQHLAELGNASPAHFGDEPTISLSSRFSLSPILLELAFPFFLYLQDD
jgi:centromeric protein E